MAKQKEMRVEGISRDQLDDMIAHWERFAKCYFWSPPGSAGGRRSEERRRSRYIDFIVDGMPCIYEVLVTCSCQNYYCCRTLTVDGLVKPQGLRYLKKLAEYGVFESKSEGVDADAEMV